MMNPIFKPFLASLVLLVGVAAEAAKPAYLRHLDAPSQWTSAVYPSYKNLSPSFDLPGSTLAPGASSEALEMLQNLRYNEFHADSFRAAPPSRLFQFKSETQYASPQARNLLRPDFWSLANFERLAQVRFAQAGQNVMLSYNLAGLAEVTCRFDQRVLTAKDGEFQAFARLAQVVTGASTTGRRLGLVVIQKCTDFSHLMTHNIQVNFVFAEGSFNSDGRVSIVGYNQSFIKQSSMSKLNLAFLRSGVETGVANEIFKQFLVLDRNVRSAVGSR